MSYKWETKFSLGDRVKLNYDSIVGTILQVNIMLADSNLDYWKKVYPEQPDGNHHPISYNVYADGHEDGDPSAQHTVSERGLSLIGISEA